MPHSEAWLQSALARIEEQLVAGALDAQDAAQCIASVIASTTGLDGAAIALVQGESLTCIRSDGLAPRTGSVLGSTFGLYAECISSGRMVWCQNATTDPRAAFQEDVPTGVRSAIVLPLWMGGRIRGILAVFAGRAGHLGSEHMTVLGTAAEIAGLLYPDNKPVSKNRTDTPTQAGFESSVLGTSGVQLTKPQGFLVELLADQKLSAPKHSRLRVPLFVLAGLGLVLLCGALFGGTAHLRDLVYPNHKNSSQVQQLSTVSMEIGDPVLSDSASSKNERTPRMTGGYLSTRVNPVYPAIALRNGVEGDVKGVVVVDEEGVVNEVRISSGDHELATAVASALGHWRYSPFRLEAHPVGVAIPFRVTFGLKLPLADRMN